MDTTRRYLCKEAPYGGELSYNEENLREMHNADLCNTLGNLVNRATTLCKKFCDGLVPDVSAPPKNPVDLTSIIDAYCTKMDQCDLQGGAATAIAGFRSVNEYLQGEAPWKKKGDENAEFRKIVVRATLEAIYALTHLLMPFLPVGCKEIYKKLGTEPVSLVDLNRDCRNLAVGTIIQAGEVLYKKTEEESDNNGNARKKKESYEEAQRRKKEKKEAAIASSEKGRAATGDANQSDFTKIEIRVGKIIEVWNHEGADKLYCEKIDVGEEAGPREIASGLREYYTIEDMQDKLVLVVCNLKASKILGFSSNGMVLAAKGDDGKTELVEPPEGSEIGERVYIEGLEGKPFSSSQVKKKKIWANVSKDLKTGDGGVAMWQGKTIRTSKGECKASSLVGSPIS